MGLVEELRALAKRPNTPRVARTPCPTCTHAADRIEELEAKDNRVCRWKRHGVYMQAPDFDARQLDRHHEHFNFKYCPYCGGKVEVSDGTG